MRLSSPPLITSGFLSLFLLAIYAFMNWDQWFTNKLDNINDEGSAEMTAETVRQISFNEQGEKHYLLEADSMVQYIKLDQNLLVRPKVLFFKEQLPSWQTESAEAVSINKGDKLLLTGQVKIQQKSVDPAATLETETLTLYPDRYFATTEDKVTIRQRGAYIEAIGMEADLNNNKLILRQKVISIYEPEKS